jgi:hypothetical protein
MHAAEEQACSIRAKNKIFIIQIKKKHKSKKLI